MLKNFSSIFYILLHSCALLHLCCICCIVHCTHLKRCCSGCKDSSDGQVSTAQVWKPCLDPQYQQDLQAQQSSLVPQAQWWLRQVEPCSLYSGIFCCLEKMSQLLSLSLQVQWEILFQNLVAEDKGGHRKATSGYTHTCTHTLILPFYFLRQYS